MSSVTAADLDEIEARLQGVDTITTGLAHDLIEMARRAIAPPTQFISIKIDDAAQKYIVDRLRQLEHQGARQRAVIFDAQRETEQDRTALRARVVLLESALHSVRKHADLRGGALDWLNAADEIVAVIRRDHVDESATTTGGVTGS